MVMIQRTDPFIEEIHEARREIAKRFEGDIRRISEDARQRQIREGRPVWHPEAANRVGGQIAPPAPHTT
jgi:hypothetical protein